MPELNLSLPLPEESKDFQPLPPTPSSVLVFPCRRVLPPLPQLPLRFQGFSKQVRCLEDAELSFVKMRNQEETGEFGRGACAFGKERGGNVSICFSRLCAAIYNAG